jgi:ankyrin repeat protein
MSGLEDLLSAVYNGDLERVKRLVNEVADVKERDFLGLTPFLYTACQGHIHIMHWLLSEGHASLAERTTNQSSALLLATGGGRFPDAVSAGEARSFDDRD